MFAMYMYPAIKAVYVWKHAVSGACSKLRFIYFSFKIALINCKREASVNFALSLSEERNSDEYIYKYMRPKWQSTLLNETHTAVDAI